MHGTVNGTKFLLNNYEEINRGSYCSLANELKHSTAALNSVKFLPSLTKIDQWLFHSQIVSQD